MPTMTDAKLDELVIRLHNATGLSQDGCKQYLLMVIAHDKEAIVVEFEQGKRRFDPLNKKSAG